MDLLEVAAGPNRVVTFDGRVLEVFGGSVRRFHVKLLSVTVSGPDKHGSRNVVLRQAGIENSLPPRTLAAVRGMSGKSVDHAVPGQLPSRD